MPGIIVNGACGRMGRELVNLILEDEALTLAACVDKFASDDGIYKNLSDVKEEADIIIDFSNHTSSPELCEYAKNKKIPLVIATTGHTSEEKEMIFDAAKTVPVFYSANMSLGVALLASLAKKTAALFPNADIEIIEKHHNRKLDAPSGTALLLAEKIKSVRENALFKLGRSGNAKREPNEIGIHAVRAGNIVGEHEIIVCTDSQTITLKHEAHTRALFAEGAIAAAKFLAHVKEAGLYDMSSMLEE